MAEGPFHALQPSQLITARSFLFPFICFDDHVGVCTSGICLDINAAVSQDKKQGTQAWHKSGKEE